MNAENRERQTPERVERWDVVDSTNQTVARRLDAFAADLRCASLNKHGSQDGFDGPFRSVRLVELREGEAIAEASRILPSTDRYVRCSVELVEELIAAASEPITIQITRDDGTGELWFTAKRHDCPHAAPDGGAG